MAEPNPDPNVAVVYSGLILARRSFNRCRTRVTIVLEYRARRKIAPLSFVPISRQGRVLRRRLR